MKKSQLKQLIKEVIQEMGATTNAPKYLYRDASGKIEEVDDNFALDYIEGVEDNQLGGVMYQRIDTPEHRPDFRSLRTWNGIGSQPQD